MNAVPLDSYRWAVRYAPFSVIAYEGRYIVANRNGTHLHAYTLKEIAEAQARSLNEQAATYYMLTEAP